MTRKGRGGGIINRQTPRVLRGKKKRRSEERKKKELMGAFFVFRKKGL